MYRLYQKSYFFPQHPFPWNDYSEIVIDIASESTIDQQEHIRFYWLIRHSA